MKLCALNAEMPSCLQDGTICSLLPEEIQSQAHISRLGHQEYSLGIAPPSKSYRESGENCYGKPLMFTVPYYALLLGGGSTVPKVFRCWPVRLFDYCAVIICADLFLSSSFLRGLA